MNNNYSGPMDIDGDNTSGPMDIDGDNTNTNTLKRKYSENLIKKDNRSDISLSKRHKAPPQKSVYITAAIFGHGGLPQDTFPRPPENVTLNILGFAPSGFCSLISKEYENYIDSLLTSDPSEVTPKLLTEVYLELAKIYRQTADSSRQQTVSRNNNGDLWSYYEDFGKKGKTRSNKIYEGATTEEVRNETRLKGLTDKGPLLKIYSTIVKDGLITDNDTTVQSFTLTNNICLDKVLKFIVDKLPIPIQDYPYQIFVDLFDETCNYTPTPNMPFLDEKSSTYNVHKGGKSHKRQLSRPNTNTNTRKHLKRKNTRNHLKRKTTRTNKRTKYKSRRPRQTQTLTLHFKRKTKRKLKRT